MILGDLAAADFTLATIHRSENTDEPGHLAAVLDGLASTALPVLLPLHPQTRRRVREFGLSPAQRGIRACDTPGYKAFLALMERARLVISDSGGVQEEATIIGKPLIVLRKPTEGPEALDDLSRLTSAPEDLAGISAELLAIQAAGRGPTPFGDGQASQRISASITTLLTRHAHGPSTIVSPSRAGGSTEPVR